MNTVKQVREILIRNILTSITHRSLEMLWEANNRDFNIDQKVEFIESDPVLTLLNELYQTTLKVDPESAPKEPELPDNVIDITKRIRQ